MDRIVKRSCFVLFALLFLCDVVFSQPLYKTRVSIHNNNDFTTTQPNLWFGHRQERKKRNLENYPNSEVEQLATLIDVAENTPWAIIAVNDAKRHVLNFIPRLGRDSDEELIAISGDRWFQEPEALRDLISQRSPPFAPRLGRHLPSFQPNLKQENYKY